MTLESLMRLTRNHIDKTQNGSAVVCYEDAVRLIKLGGPVRLAQARRRLIDSLRYSIGVLHADYQLANADAYSVILTQTGEALSDDRLTYENACTIAREKEAAVWNDSAQATYRVVPFVGSSVGAGAQAQVLKHD